MDLIPTRCKERLPKGFSYAVGAEMVSTALHGVPQYDELELTFSWRDSFWASQYQERLAAKGAISVIEARYFRGWTIEINSVPSSHAVLTRELVSGTALPALASVLLNESIHPEHFRWIAALNLASDSLQINPDHVSMPRAGGRRYRAPIRPRGR